MTSTAPTKSIDTLDALDDALDDARDDARDDIDARLFAIAEEWERAERVRNAPWEGPDGIDRLIAVRRSMSALQATEMAGLARMWQARQSELPPNASSSDFEMAHRILVSELAVALNVSERTVSERIDEATCVVEKFPATLEALEAGQIGFGHLRVIVQHGSEIEDDDARARYEKALLERAPHSTPGRLRRPAQRVAAQLGDVSFEKRHEEAKAQRGVRIYEIDNGMSELIHTLPTALAEALWDRLTRQAKAIKDAAAGDDPRTMDQIRGDLATELLLTGQPSGAADAPHAAGIGIRAEVAITIPALTLLGLSDEPATIAGRGPIDLETARKLAGSASHWVRVITHPVSEMVITADSYRPSKKMRRYLLARDKRCTFPCCNAAGWRSDIDHTIEWQHGGKTVPENLAILCRSHHTLKSIGAWKVKQTSPGILEWTAPSGRVTTNMPDTPVRFS